MSVIPCLRYRDAPAAIDWLCRTMGFTRQLVVPGENGRIAHAQLALGRGMVMLGSVGEPDSNAEYDKVLRQPEDIGGYETQTPYVVVPDADEVYRKVKAAGGRIAIDIKDEKYGGRGFGFRDPEGRFWYVGTYDPFAEDPA